jgi:PhzF family phenazine biosynthesis protein
VKIPLYQIDAFTAQPFAGNPAAVCPLESWLDDAALQAIANENNLAETAFFVPEGAGFHLRWFTPAIEVDLCGHATLATAWVLFNRLGWQAERIDFRTPSGTLTVKRDGERLAMDFPSRPPAAIDGIDAVAAALGARPRALLAARDALAVFESERDLASLKPDFRALAALDHFAVIATAPAADGRTNFVSRYFAPRAGIDEDPVTGSAHCTLIPYWAKRLGKTKLFARQISRRGGELWCEDRGERVTVAGQCAPMIEGTFSF